MRTNFVRGFVVVLALTGFGASTVAAKPATAKVGVNAKVLPSIPLCPWNDPNACGID